MLKTESKITSPDNILYSQVGDELIILDLLSGKYFSLNETAAKIFKMFIKDSLSFGEVMSILKTEYPEAPEYDILKDVNDIVNDLKKSGIFNFEDN
ncbi:MAG: PqqD family protein [Candidatus Muirbacterium halophilum]|nr:PqqD family protein [Candidatus Muirbacterium halophilum]MCK9476922.1 PqqD family protein [Candidatus Muirbacterium halophilum]